MRSRTLTALTAVAGLALAGTAACDLFNPDPRPSLAVRIETEDAVVGAPVLLIVQLADQGGLRTLTVDWGDGTEVETLDLSGTSQTLDLDHVFDTEGRFEIQVTVRDSASQLSGTTVAVTVGPAPEPEPEP